MGLSVRAKCAPARANIFQKVARAQFFPNRRIRIRGEKYRALRVFEIAQLTIFGCAIKNRFKVLNGTTNHFKTKQGGIGLYAHATIKQFVPAHFFAEHTQQPTMAQKKTFRQRKTN